MKNYFRIFGYGEKLNWYVPAYIVFTFFGIVFSAFNLALLAPLLNILFNEVESSEVLTEPENHFSASYIIYVFKSKFINIIEQDGKQVALLFVCITIAVSVFFTNFFRYLSNLVNARIVTDVLRNLRLKLFKSITLLDMSFFTNERKGDLISRMTNDVQEVETSVLGSLKTLFKEPLTIVIYFVFLFIISYELTLFTIILLPVGGGLLAEIIKRLKKQAKESQESLGRIVNIFDETLSGMRVVKAFTATGFVNKKMEGETANFRKVNFSIARKRDLASPLSEFLGVGIVIAILYYGGTLILNDSSSLDAGGFITYLAFYSQIISPGKAFSRGISNLQKGLVSVERIFATMGRKSTITNKPGAKSLKNFNDQIEYRDVSFSYGQERIISNISFEIPRGSTVALVGPSGGGKSTIADLLPRFYDPNTGSIMIDGIDLRDYNVDSLRRNIGIVTQESILFNDSVINNIAFGIDNPDIEELEKAARIANAHDFIMELEDGYNTIIGERGGKLSGGQRQRISIARAVMKDPDILILDEATSALDSESEKLVQDALQKLMKNRTVLVIAHRLSTVRHANEILIIDQGNIVERGTHEALFRKKGLYYKLSKMQNVFVDSE